MATNPLPVQSPNTAVALEILLDHIGHKFTTYGSNEWSGHNFVTLRCDTCDNQQILEWSIFDPFYESD